MTERPHHVKCVLLRLSSDRNTWCGRVTPKMEFTFSDAAHALLSARHGGDMRICPACSKAMADVLVKGTYCE